MSEGPMLSDPTVDTMYKLTQAAKLCGIGKSKLWDEINAGKIEARKCGGINLIAGSEIKRWQAALPPLKPQKG